MSPNERKNTLVKIVLVISILLFAASVINLLFPNLFSSKSNAGESSSQKDLESVYKQLQDQYNEKSEKIRKANENAKGMNDRTSELKGIYAEMNIPKYAIGGGLSIILGLWISTIILYFKEKKSMFKE